ncbi:MAG: competence protein ComK [Bacilli bacterium]|nr:competence protein ComK [Bacilli bacterium]
MKDYEINEQTMAIIPISYNQSLVKELDNEYIIDKCAYKIMEDSCSFYGSSYTGRLNAAKKMLDSNYKVPILVEDSEYIVFFPTKSSLLDDCYWINYNYIKKYDRNGNYTTITFKNNQQLDVDISKLSLENQISRSYRLELISRKRKLKK